MSPILEAECICMKARTKADLIPCLQRFNRVIAFWSVQRGLASVLHSSPQVFDDTTGKPFHITEQEKTHEQ